MMAHAKALSWRARMRVLWTRIESGWIGVVALFGSLWAGLMLADALAGGAL